MNEGNARPQKRRRSFLWLWILLLLFAFTAGIILGLKLNTMPMPNDVRARLYPVLEAIIPGSTANGPQEPGIAVTPPVQETPAPVELPPAPAELIVPVETPAPAAEESANTDPLTGFEIIETEGLALEDTARFESRDADTKYIGIDAALEAALKHAEVEKKDAGVTGVYRTKDAVGQTVYEVSFTVGEYSYEYVLSAEDGEILGWKMSGLHMEDLATFGTEPPESTPAAETPKPEKP